MASVLGAAVAAMLAGARRNLLHQGLSAAQQAEILDKIGASSPPTISVWFSADKLLRRIATNMSLGGSAGGSGDVIMDFTNYGVPVHITAPNAKDVISYAKFMQLAQDANH